MTKSTEPAGDLDSAEVELDQAEQELQESLSLVSAIEERVSTGDETITSEDLASRHSVGRFAQLRVQALRKKVERLRGDAYRAQCQQLADEATKLAAEPAESAAKLTAGMALIGEYFASVDGHNDRRDDLYRQVRELLSDEHTAQAMPSASSARLGWSGSDIILGRRRIRRVDPMVWLSGALAKLCAPRGGIDVVARRDGLDAADQLARQHDERPAVEGMRYFIGPNGHMIGFTRALTAQEAKALRPLTTDEVEQYAAGGAA